MEPKSFQLRDGSTLLVRAATTADLAAIFEIYNYEILNSTATMDTVPIKEVEWLEWFHTTGGRYPIYVAELEAVVVGWSRLYAYSPRRAFDRCAECAVYTHVSSRNLGIGKILLQLLIDACRSIAVHLIIARITAENAESIVLHERLGFKVFGVLERSGEKFGRLLDLTFMSLHLD